MSFQEVVKIINRKIKNNKGSAMTLAIVVLFIATMAIGLFTSQVINQIKFTKSTEDSMYSRYEVEGSVEVVLGELIDSININVETEKINHGNSGNYDTVKKIVIDYLSLINEGTSIYLKNKDYYVNIESKINQSEIEVENENSKENISNSSNTTTIVLKKNVNSLEKVKLPFYIDVNHKLGNTKAKKFKLDIEIVNIAESSSYGISYKLKEIK